MQVLSPHEPIAQVIDVSCSAPPARHQQLSARVCGDGLQMPYCPMIRVLPEEVLLGIGQPEDGVPQQLERHDAYNCP